MGYGSFGKKYYKNLVNNKNFVLKAIFRKKKYSSIKFKSLSKKEIINNNIDCAIVCTPVETHYKIAKLFIENKIPIILEKPAANNLSQIQKLELLSSKYKSSVIVNYSDLFNENLNFLIQNKNKIGKFLFYEAIFGKFSNKYKFNFLPYQDWIVHPLAIINKFSRKFFKLSIISNKLKTKNKSNYQEIIFNLKDKNQIVGRVYYSNMIKKKSRRIKIFGDKGILSYDGYYYNKNYIKSLRKKITTKKQISPMQNLLNSFYNMIVKKKYISDLKFSFKLEKQIKEIKKN